MLINKTTGYRHFEGRLKLVMLLRIYMYEFASYKDSIVEPVQVKQIRQKATFHAHLMESNWEVSPIMRQMLSEQRLDPFHIPLL